MPAKQLIVGFTWTCERSGKTWSVTKMVRPGLYQVVRSDKRQTGEMYARAIRVLMEKHGHS